MPCQHYNTGHAVPLLWMYIYGCERDIMPYKN